MNWKFKDDFVTRKNWWSQVWYMKKCSVSFEGDKVVKLGDTSYNVHNLMCNHKSQRVECSHEWTHRWYNSGSTNIRACLDRCRRHYAPKHLCGENDIRKFFKQKILPGYQQVQDEHKNLTYSLPNMEINNGDKIFLQSKRFNFVFCDAGRCNAGAKCPEHTPRRTRHTKCWGESVTIYNSAGSGTITSGQVVWLKWKKAQWFTCAGSDACKAAAGCPGSASKRSDVTDGGCWGERFKIYNSKGDGPITEGQQVWLKYQKTDKWVYCDNHVCSGKSTCPNDATKRASTSDSDCWGERFVIWT